MVFIACLLAGFVVLGAQYGALPAKVATHFGPGGWPNGWSSRTGYVVGFVVVDLIWFGMFLLIPITTRKFPAKWVNLPHKDYWLAPANRNRAMDKLASWFYVFGTAMAVFMIFFKYLMYAANTANPVRLNEPALFTGLGIFAAFIVGAIAWLYVMFRKPRAGDG